MTPQERKAALARLKHSYSASAAWTTVAQWIRRMVAIEPSVMRRVAARTFGDLGSWIERGSRNVGVCGCLVGSTALELVDARNHFKPDPYFNGFTRTTGEWKGERCPATTAVAELVRGPQALKDNMDGWACRAGIAASNLLLMLTDDTAVALIKDEIHRQLRARAKRRAARKVAA